MNEFDIFYRLSVISPSTNVDHFVNTFPAYYLPIFDFYTPIINCFANLYLKPSGPCNIGKVRISLLTFCPYFCCHSLFNRFL